MGLPSSPAGGVVAAALLVLLLPSRALCNCPAPNLPPHSRLRGGGALDPTYPVGTVLRFQCIPGYEHIAGIVPSMTCLATLAWTSVPTFCRGKRCPVPNLPYGLIVSTSDLRLGEEVTFVCEHGFRMRGHATLRCILKGNTVEWNHDIPLCERIPCHRPAKIPNGHYNAHPLDSYEFGEAVTYRCDPGLTLIGKDTIACIATPDGLNGMWNYPPPECKRVSCPQPSIQNGRFNHGLAFVYNYDEKISFTCNSPYNAVGNGLTTCGSDSKWHPPPPFCIRGAVPPVPPTVPPVHPPVPPVHPPVPPVHPPVPPVHPPVPPVHPPPPSDSPETVTDSPAEEGAEELPPLPTQRTPSDGTVPGFWKTLSIALGSVAAALLLSGFVCCIFATMKRSSPQEKIELSHSPSAPPAADYTEVPETDTTLEMDNL